MTCKSKGTLKKVVHGVISTEAEDWTSNCTQLCFVQLISLRVILCWLTNLAAIVNEDLLHLPQAASEWFKVCCLDSSMINNSYSTTRLHLRSCTMCVQRCLVPERRSPRPSQSDSSPVVFAWRTFSVNSLRWRIRDEQAGNALTKTECACVHGGLSGALQDVENSRKLGS